MAPRFPYVQPSDRLPLVGVMGRARSGKDTLAGVLVNEFGFTKRGFADPLREAMLALDPIVGHEPGEPGALVRPVRYADALRRVGYERTKDLYPEARALLQRLGTDSIRALDEGFWARIAEDRIRTRTEPLIFTDVRFLNEANLIREYGGYLIRVVRPDLPESAELHASETALDDYPANLIVTNDGTLEALRRTVRALGSHLRGLYAWPS